MEYVLNHALDNSDTSRQPDRRMRPQSAFVPRQSYFKHKGEEDDLGRSVLQHRPLAKGEFTQLSLAKVFEDEPGMRPKVFAPPTVNKMSYALMSHDISGAAPQGRSAPNRPRDTDPNTPRYILPGTSAILAAPDTASAAVAPDSSTDGTALQEPQSNQQPNQQQQQSTQTPLQDQLQPQQLQLMGQTLQMQQRPVRDTLNVSDINAVDSVSERPQNYATRPSQMSTRDVEGSWPGWEPPFRAHVGRNLRDPGLDVSDISGKFNRRRIFSARPNSRGGGGGGGVGSGGPEQSQPTPMKAPPGAAMATTLGCSPTPDSDPGRQQQQQSYLPPPLTWQPVQYDTGQPWSSSEGSSSGGSGGCGSGGTTRRYSHNVQQQQPKQPQEQLPQQSEAVVYAAGAWPTMVTMPLRPVLSPPPFATYIPTGSVAAVLSTSLDPATASITAAVADHPSTTVGKPAPGRRDAHARHVAKRTVAEVQRSDAAEAQRVISLLRPTREVVEEFFSSCRRLDRESCGKVAPTDFMHALERANLMACLEPGREGGSGGVEVAVDLAAAAMARGLQDGCGMVSYRQLARSLLGQSMPRTSSSKAAPIPTVPAVAVQPTMVNSCNVALSTVAPAPVAVESTAPVVAVGLRTLIGTAVPQSTPISGLDQVPGGISAARLGSTECAGGGAVDGNAGPPICPTADTPSAGVTMPRPATPRRGVNWAPEPPPAAAQPAADVVVPAIQPPPPPINLSEQHRLERQERQLRRQGSTPQRRPLSATPAGVTAVTPKGVSAVAAVFKLLGAPQPILYDTPPPPSVLASGVPPAPSSTSAVAAMATAPAIAAAARSITASAAAPPTTSYDSMGVASYWPPEPRPCNLQKRPPATIMDNANVQLRDVCDTTYFPYKNHALWFSGRVGPAGPAEVGGPGEAAREYLPSADPTSFIVGKGHHRVSMPPNGLKLDPEVEAVLVAKMRPRSAVVGSPEATYRAKTASSVVAQLNVENPLLYPGNVDPTAPAGAALKSMLGPLYSTASSSAAAASGGARPSTAGPRRTTHLTAASTSRCASLGSGSGTGVAGAGSAGGAATGGGSSRPVGRVALERLMHHEEVATVRRLL